MIIKVKEQNREYAITDFQRENLLQILQDNHVPISNFCQGNGTCGKCKVKVVSGELPITTADRRTLTKTELDSGIRLACKARITNLQRVDSVLEENKVPGEQKTDLRKAIKKEQLTIEIPGYSEEHIAVEGIGKENESRMFFMDSSHVRRQKNEIKDTFKEEPTFFIAIDIGTTTIALALVNRENGEICDTYTGVNHQRKLGADVISRIEASNNGRKEELKKLIEQDLWSGIRKWKEQNISKIIIAGNTTMIHLLMGYSCETLGKHPFYSEHLNPIECSLKDCINDIVSLEERVLGKSVVAHSVFCKMESIPVFIFPGISAFVGGDIVADILLCPEFQEEEINLLVDLGTNGELVLGNKEKLLVTSTAAGPAFEGGNIGHGTASVPGSICRVKIQNQRAMVRTIKEELPPVGICGTGLVSTIVQLKQNNIVNEQGELRFPYAKNGYPLWTFENGDKIILSQKDIREFQMAKSAIRAGVELLMEECGCREEEIQNVFIAGGFGKALDIEDMIALGILPAFRRDKIKILGNGALKGAISLGMDLEKMEKVKKICGRATSVSLSQSEKFREKYMENMRL